MKYALLLIMTALGFQAQAEFCTQSRGSACNENPDKYVVGRAHGYVYDTDDFETAVSELQAQADIDGQSGCLQREEAVRYTLYNIRRARIDHGYLHLWNVNVTAGYVCEQ